MAYTADAKLLLRAFKELGESSLAAPIAQSIYPLLSCFEQTPTRLVPVPSNVKSIRERGFNPAEIIAREIARNLPNLRFENLLARTRQTLDQSKLTPLERSDNQVGSMVAQVGRERIIHIDDVVTTGATLKEATHALENSGHSVIGFLTFAETEAKRCNLTTQATLPADGGTSWNSKFPQKI